MNVFAYTCTEKSCDGEVAIQYFSYKITDGRVRILLFGSCTKCNANSIRTVAQLMRFLNESVSEEKRIGFRG